MGCNKEPYDTFKKAKQAAGGVIDRTGTSMRIYKCEHCGSFHLTSVKKNKLRPVKDGKYPLKVDYKKPEKMPLPKINIGYKPEPVFLRTYKVFNQK